MATVGDGALRAGEGSPEASASAGASAVAADPISEGGFLHPPQADARTHSPEPGSLPLSPLALPSEPHPTKHGEEPTITPTPRPVPAPKQSVAVAKLKRESVISLGLGDYAYDPDYALHGDRRSSSSSSRDRSRVERWLEQQTRFASVAQDEEEEEGGGGGVDADVDVDEKEKGKTRADAALADEEADLPDLARGPKPAPLGGEEGLEVGGSRAGISLAPAAVDLEGLPPLLSLSLSSSAALPAERAHADRADSPLLGYSSPPESPSAEEGRAGAERRRSREGSDRLVDVSSESERGPDLDPHAGAMPFPGRNYAYARGLPVDVDEDSTHAYRLSQVHLHSYSHSATMAGEEMVASRKDKDVNVLAMGKEKDKDAHPALLEPPKSELRLSSSSFSLTPRPPFTHPHPPPPASEDGDTRPRPGSFTTIKAPTAGPSPISSGAKSATTTASSTPESSFTVPSAVSAPSDALCTPPTPHLPGPPLPQGGAFPPDFGLGEGASSLGVALALAPGSASAVEDPNELELGNQEGILEYPLSLPLTLPSPLSFPAFSSSSPSPSPASPANTSSNSTSTFTTQQQQRQHLIQGDDGEMKQGKKKHSPAPSYSSSNTASSSSHSPSHSYSVHSVHSAQSHSALSHAYSHSQSQSHSRSSSKAGSVVGSHLSHSSSSRPLLSRSASTSSFSRQPSYGQERQRKAYLPLGPATTPSSSASHSRTPSSLSGVSAASSGGARGRVSSTSIAGSMIPVQRPERKSSLANLRASLAMSSPGIPSPSPSLSRRPSRTMHAHGVLRESAEVDGGMGIGAISVERPERKSSLVNLRASTATIGASGSMSPPLSSSLLPSPSISRRPSRVLRGTTPSAIFSEHQTHSVASEAEEPRGSTFHVAELAELELEAQASIASEGEGEGESGGVLISLASSPAPTPAPVGTSLSLSTMGTAAAPGSPGLGGGVGMYHLPTAMLRASRSSSQLLLDRDASLSLGVGANAAASSSAFAVGGTTTTANTTTTTPIPTSPLPPSAPPTRRQSRAAEAPYGHTASLSISSSVTSSSRSRSRAGSITLNSLVASSTSNTTSNSISTQVHSLVHAPSMSSIASGASSRHAVYIDSDQVREKLDELLARAADGSEGALELERQWLYDSEAEAEAEDEGDHEREGEEEEEEEVLSIWRRPGRGGGEDEGDRTFTGMIGTSAIGGSAGGIVAVNSKPAQGQGQERSERRETHAQPHGVHRGFGGTRTPSALNLNLTMDTTTTTTTITNMTSSATSTLTSTRMPPPAPVNTPSTAFSMSAVATPSTDLPSAATTASTSTATTTYFTAVHSASTAGLSSVASPSLYANPHASSSQVYIGPGQLQQQQAQAQAQASQASSSPSRSSARSATGSGRGSASGSGSGSGGAVHSRDTSRSSNSNSHSSSGHSRMPSSISRTQSRTQIHSRTSSSQSRLVSHSRTHSRAASKEKSGVSMSSMSPKEMLAQLPPTPLSAPAASGASSAMSGDQSPLPMSMSMSIPVPLRLPPLPSAGRKPSRPPPAPLLDLGGVDVDVGASMPVGGEVMLGDEHEERMREMVLAAGPDADEQLGVDPAVAMAGGGFVGVGAEVIVEDRMVFARGGRDDEEGGDAFGYESDDDGFEAVRETRRRTRVPPKVPSAAAEEVRRVSEVQNGRAAEESGSEGEEMTAEDIERMQFLRGLKLEDRMEMPDMPAAADLDSMLVEFPRAPGSVPPSPERVLRGSSAAASAQPEVHFAEDGVLPVATPPRGGLDVPSGPSMSRWSLTSSIQDESPSGSDGKDKEKKEKEKERKRKSFVSFGGGKEKEKESGNLSPGWEGEKDKEKKRGRLASFISRLSSVGGGPAPLAISSSSSGSMVSSAEDVPPVPSVPAVSVLLPSPQIMDISRKKEKEKEALPPLPSDTDGAGRARASPRATPPALKLDLSKTQNQTKQKYVVEKDEVVEVAGSVKGVWGSSAASTSTSAAPAPTKAAKSAPGSPVDIAYARAVMGMPTFSFGRSYPKPPKPKKPVPSRNQSTQPLGKTSSDGSIVSKPSTSTSASRSTKEAEQSNQLARERSNSTAGSSGSGAKRPTLVKSASASLLRQIPPPPTMARAGSAAPGVPASAHLQTYPPQPESQAQHVQYQNQVQHQYRVPRVSGVDGSLPPTPSSLASTDVDEQEDEELDPEMERIRREKAHEERWARVKVEADAQEAASGGPRLHVQPRTESPVLQRPRLKSMTSLGNMRSASASANALASFPSVGQQNQLSPKSGKGFRGFVERMGLVGSSASNTPVSSYPGTPLNGSSPGPLSVSIPGSASASTAAFPLSPTPEVVESTPTTSWSPSHSPTTSLSGGNSISAGPGLGSVSLLGMKGAKGPKRKLVISGVGLDDVSGYEAVKSWCESFGEIREMTRAPNGSLHVDFKKASVAETVCRLQAQVYIKGAGSVSLSWYTKKKPT